MAREFQVDVPSLQGIQNIDSWKRAIKFALQLRCLTMYIDKGVPEPEGDDEKAQWEKDRAFISAILLKSIVDEIDVIGPMKDSGWDPSEKDPKKTYDLIIKSVVFLEKSDMSYLLHDFTHMHRQNYPSLRSYIAKANYLKERLKVAGYGLGENQEVAIVLWGLKDTHPDHHADWIQKFNGGSLTWAALMNDLQAMSVVESRNYRRPKASTSVKSTGSEMSS
ncbi:hypothetical protein B0T25DRAFT_236514 [Lasiosphaeria hispida]|uniref:Uncharacterized protein n=1 Tax=Lasiosphaeria hispida TaxID=260671 RepID=A0AAJ0MC24_9PEZI|nr:hypothetical protein B0T25DRAFT_236514 [Lasiosphaeria hispida]